MNKKSIRIKFTFDIENEREKEVFNWIDALIDEGLSRKKISKKIVRVIEVYLSVVKKFGDIEDFFINTKQELEKNSSIKKQTKKTINNVKKIKKNKSSKEENKKQDGKESIEQKENVQSESKQKVEIEDVKLTVNDTEKVAGTYRETMLGFVEKNKLNFFVKK